MTENLVLKSHQEKREDLSDALKLKLQTHRNKNFSKSVTNDFSSFHTNAQIWDDALEL